MTFPESIKLEKNKKHNIEIVVDNRLVIKRTFARAWRIP